MSEYSHLTQTSKDRRLWLRVRIHSKQNTNNSFIFIREDPISQSDYRLLKCEVRIREYGVTTSGPATTNNEFRI